MSPISIWIINSFTFPLVWLLHTATFPFLNRLFSGEAAKGGESGGQEESGARSREKERKDPKNGKRKYLENY